MRSIVTYAGEIGIIVPPYPLRGRSGWTAIGRIPGKGGGELGIAARQVLGAVAYSINVDVIDIPMLNVRGQISFCNETDPEVLTLYGMNIDMMRYPPGGTGI
jgi:hypothetical protein